MMRRSLSWLMLLTDIGFLAYWAATFLQWIPKSYVYQDYSNPLLVAWNLSFLPLDLFISGTGLASVALWRKQRSAWQPLALISMVLTFCSGLQAIAFWSFRADFDPVWWIPNLFLLLYPCFYIPGLIRSEQALEPTKGRGAA